MAKQPPFKIDDDSYREGQEAFKRGATLRSIVEQLATFGTNELEDRKTFSGVLGFGDALLDHLRKPLTATDLYRAGAEIRPQRSDRPEEKVR